jgi:NADH-quinone oxidoreductase subunit F
VLAFHNLMQFYRHESCGQCTPCREGSAWLNRILDAGRRRRGRDGGARPLHEIANNIMGNTICAFGEGTAMPALGFIKKFRKELEEYVTSGGKAGTGTLAPDYFPPRGGAAKPAMSKTVPASPLTRR